MGPLKYNAPLLANKMHQLGYQKNLLKMYKGVFIGSLDKAKRDDEN